MLDEMEMNEYFKKLEADTIKKVETKEKKIKKERTTLNKTI